MTMAKAKRIPRGVHDQHRVLRVAVLTRLFMTLIIMWKLGETNTTKTCLVIESTQPALREH